MFPRARPRALLPAIVLAVSIGVGAHASAAGAEGPGYDGAASGLRARVVQTAEPGDPGDTVEVRGSGFLANSAVTVRLAGGGAVRASADEVGSVVARLHLRGDVGGRVWVTATGTDPSFQRRVVTDHLTVGTDGSPVSPTTIVLIGVTTCLTASVAVGVARQRSTPGGAPA